MGKTYAASLNSGSGFEVKSKSPIDTRMVVKYVADLGGNVGGKDYGDVDTWNITPCYTGMTVIVSETWELWVLKELNDNGVKPKTWKKIGYGSDTVTTTLKIIGGDVDET